LTNSFPSSEVGRHAWLLKPATTLCIFMLFCKITVNSISQVFSVITDSKFGTLLSKLVTLYCVVNSITHRYQNYDYQPTPQRRVLKQLSSPDAQQTLS
jgi:hypothetical protein